jgi:hypothetical protein
MSYRQLVPINYHEAPMLKIVKNHCYFKGHNILSSQNITMCMITISISALHIMCVPFIYIHWCLVTKNDVNVSPQMFEISLLLGAHGNTSTHVYKLYKYRCAIKQKE